MAGLDLTKLYAPFAPDVVSWRVGSTNKEKTSGLALAYLDARDVMNRLDEVCGPANWQRRHPWSDGKRMACEIGIRIGDEWVWKGDGAGDSDVEAEKGAFSDSFKRAAVSWGVGRYLYDLDSPWVKIEPFGRSYKIAEAEKAKLRQILQRHATGQPGPRQAPPPDPDPVAPKPPAQTGGAKADDPKAAAERLRNAIDDAPHLAGLNVLMREAGQDPKAADPVPGSTLAKIKAASEDAYHFMVDRANKRRHALAQAPGSKAA